MKVSSRKQTHGSGYTEYRLSAEIDGVVYAAQHIIPDHAYSALKVADADALIEAQLWQQLMHTLEHHLRKAAYAHS